MANNVTTQSGTLASVPASTTFATDEVSGVHYQFIKIANGTDGATDVATVSSGGALSVDTRPQLTAIAVTPTVSTSPAYTAKDAIGGLMTFANAARSSGGAIYLDHVTISDLGAQRGNADLILFKVTPGSTTVTDNSVLDIADADLPNVVDTIPIGSGFYADFNDNSAATIPVKQEYVLTGTSLFAVLVCRSAVTYTSTTDLTVTVHLRQL